MKFILIYIVNIHIFIIFDFDMFYCSFVYIFYIFYINLPARLSPFCLCVVFRSGVASKHVRMPSLPAGWEEGLDDLDV